MKSVKKNIFPLMVMCFFVIRCTLPVFAAQLQAGTIQLSVEGYKGDISLLRLCSEKDVYDDTGTKVIGKEEEIVCEFSSSESGVVAEVNLYSGISYYISDGVESVSFTPEFLSAEGEVLEYVVEWGGASDSKSSSIDAVATEVGEGEVSDKTGVLVMSTQGPSAAAVGDIVKYTITEIRGERDTDTFTLQCEIPEGLELVSVFTGTYNSDAELELLCQTQNDNKWHMWGENISSLKGEIFETSDISFAKGDRICAFAISVKEAPEGFSLMKQVPMYYRVKIVDEKGLNNKSAKAKVSAYIGDKKESCEKTFSTTIQEVVQTGDENVMMVVSFIILILSVAVLFGYITVRLVGERREKKIEKNGVNVKFKKDKSAGEGVKLTFLKDKDPG